MDYSQIIEVLNKRQDIAHIRVANLDKLGLSEEEKELFGAFLPEQVLIVYGTLAPGKPNHSKIAHIPGVWERVTVTGKLENKGWGASQGFNGYVPVRPGEESIVIAAKRFRSSELNDHWTILDDFEGTGYKRILTSYTLSDGEFGVGYIYAINE